MGSIFRSKSSPARLTSLVFNVSHKMLCADVVRKKASKDRLLTGMVVSRQGLEP